MKLIVVESPTKAKTISRFIDDSFVVESSNGHIRDLPKSKLGIDLEKNFEPQYIIPVKKRKFVNQLVKKSSKFEQIYLASDEDREGEAIAWHLQYLFQNKQEKPKKYARIAFHEITEDAIKEAIKNPREIDLRLVDAQQARRILDRLVGYSLSPLLWEKIAKRLSAGRVQSVALRLIIEREREREKFKPTEYWNVIATLSPGKKQDFKAALYKIGEKKLDKFAVANEKQANGILENLKGANYSINDIKQKELKRYPLPPFITSTLQQAANNRFGYSTKKTMIIAQQLYEGIELGQDGSVGLITYMRTDSFNLSEKFLKEAQKYLKENFAKEYSPENYNFYKKKSKMAQEAHEAIRPTSAYREPDKIKDFLTSEQFKIYDLIWRRAVSCQMTAAKIDTMTVDVLAEKKSMENHYFKTSGSQIKFAGWLTLYPTKLEEILLPGMKKNEQLDLTKLDSEQHFTEPPARYSEATLVKALEEYGIGRPSTYAPTIYTLFARNYVQKENGRLIPTEIGFKVNDLLVEHFPKIVDYEFTAELEKELDEIAEGQRDWHKMMGEFYWPFKEHLDKKQKEIAHMKPIEEKTNEVCEKCGKPMLVKFSRFGKFLACSGFPECRNTKSLKPIGNANDEGFQMKCPKCKDGDVLKKRTKKGRFFYGCSKWPACDYASWKKPDTEETPDEKE